MKRQRRCKAWQASVLAGAVAFGVGGLAPAPAPAAPGFGTKSDSDREKQRAERDRQTQERRQQQEAREARARAERERQAQERPRAAEQRQAQERERSAERLRESRERAARETQARERETRARAEREPERARESRTREAMERAAREAAQRQQAAREAAERAPRQAPPRRGFGLKEPATRVLPDRPPRGETPKESPAASPEPSTGRAGAAGSPESTRRRERGWGIREPNLPRQDGSLDRYFGPRGSNVGYRPPRQTERDGDQNLRSPQPSDRSGRGERAYREERHQDGNPRRHRPRRHTDCLYDVIYLPYPVTVIRERVRTETIVLPPTTEVVVVPARPARSPESGALPLSPSERLARVVSLQEVLADIEQAWLRKEADRLLRHVRQERPFEIYRDGEFTTSLDREAFAEKTREAMERYETLSMRFDPPRILSEIEAVAAAEHRYRLADQLQRTRVVFAFAREDGAWWIVGMDYTSPDVESERGREGEGGGRARRSHCRPCEPSPRRAFTAPGARCGAPGAVVGAAGEDDAAASGDAEGNIGPTSDPI